MDIDHCTCRHRGEKIQTKKDCQICLRGSVLLRTAWKLISYCKYSKRVIGIHFKHMRVYIITELCKVEVWVRHSWAFFEWMIKTEMGKKYLKVTLFKHNLTPYNPPSSGLSTTLQEWKSKPAIMSYL